MLNIDNNLECKLAVALDEENEGDFFYLEGYAITWENLLKTRTISRDANGFKFAKKSVNVVKDLGGNPNVVINFDHWGATSNSFGRVESFKSDDIGLFVKCKCFSGYEDKSLQDSVTNVKNGILTNFSSEIKINKYELVDGVDVVTNGELFGLAVVTAPADNQANFKLLSSEGVNFEFFVDYLKKFKMSEKNAQDFLFECEKYFKKDIESLKKQVYYYQLLLKMKGL